MENTELQVIPEIENKLNSLVTELNASGWRQEDDHFLVYQVVPAIQNENGTIRQAKEGEETDAFLEVPVRRVANSLELEQVWEETAALREKDLKPVEVVHMNQKLQEALTRAGKLVTLTKGSTRITCCRQDFNSGSKPSTYRQLLKKGYREVVA